MSKMELIPISVYDEIPEEPPRYFRVGSDFYGRPDDEAEPLRLSLKVPTRFVEELELETTPRGQLAKLLTLRGDTTTIALLDDLDITAHRDFARAFWQAQAEREEARLGESLRPVASSESTEPPSDSTSETASA